MSQEGSAPVAVGTQRVIGPGPVQASQRSAPAWKTHSRDDKIGPLSHDDWLLPAHRQAGQGRAPSSFGAASWVGQRVPEHAPPPGSCSPPGRSASEATAVSPFSAALVHAKPIDRPAAPLTCGFLMRHGLYRIWGVPRSQLPPLTATHFISQTAHLVFATEPHCGGRVINPAGCLLSQRPAWCSRG